MLEATNKDQELPVSVTEVEQLAERTNPRFAQDVREFLAKVQPGDTVVEFCTSLQSWRQCMGLAGYRATRNGNLVAELIVRLN